MTDTLLFDAFLLLGLAWMLICIVYFCVRMDRCLSPVEKHAVNDQAEEPEAAYLQFLKEDTQNSSRLADCPDIESYRNRFLQTSRFTQRTAFTMNVETLQLLRNVLHDLNERVPMASYIENILREHLRAHQDLLNDAADKQRRLNTLKL